jgi:iron complex outermembrane receptor protein
MTALSGVVTIGAIGLTEPAFAQTPPQQAQTSPVEEIVVTGSRVIQNGFDSPTPVSVIAVEAIEAAARADLSDFVNTLPAVSGSSTPQSQAYGLSQAKGGINSISLHGLGPSRTLVLLDGQRVAPSSSDGFIDTSALPQGLVSRVDIVTGGASAAYGSDAVGGVVNFILDKKYTGLKGDVSGGVTTYGDDRNYKIDISGGTGFAGDRGHVIFNVEMHNMDGIPVYSAARDWASFGWTTVVNPAYGTPTAAAPTLSTAVPRFLFGPNTGPIAEVAGGIITGGALKGVTFGPGGVPRMFNYGSITSGIVTRGGDWAAQKQYQTGPIDPVQRRKNAFARASYDLTDTTEVFFEASWSDNWEAQSDGAAWYPSLPIPVTNAFLPASLQAQVVAQKLTGTFPYGAIMVDQLPLGPSIATAGVSAIQRRITNRYVIGANGAFGAFDTDWTWDTYYQRGEVHTSERTINNPIVARVTQAVDSVVNPATGQIVCRSTLANPTNGCIPYNPFGIGVNGPTVFGWMTGTSKRNQHMKEDAAAFTVNGKPFETWAGPVSVATGIEWRREWITGSSDATSLAFGWFNSSYQPTIGVYNVTEGFVEALFPLAKDTAWAQSFDVDLAGRVTHYSNSGTVETWKIGPTWQPIDDIRFRGSISHDVRAPNLGELYAGGSNSASGGAGLIDPLTGQPATGTLSINTAGNPLLKPETATSKGLGVVLSPGFWPGFTASADYWDIKMNGAIGVLAAQDILNQCYAGKTILCSAITRPPITPVLTVKAVPFNIATSIYRGVDFEVAYKFSLEDVSASMSGTLGLRFLATLSLKNFTDNGITPSIDLVGSGLYRKWKYNTTITYSNDPITIVIQPRGFSAGVTNNFWVQCTTGCPVSTSTNPTIDNQQLRADFDVDTTFTYKVDEHTATYLSVQNWLNKEPPPNASGVTGNDTSLSTTPAQVRGLYVPTGRMFRLGVRFKM